MWNLHKTVCILFYCYCGLQTCELNEATALQSIRWNVNTNETEFHVFTRPGHARKIYNSRLSISFHADAHAYPTQPYLFECTYIIWWLRWTSSLHPFVELRGQNKLALKFTLTFQVFIKFMTATYVSLFLDVIFALCIRDACYFVFWIVVVAICKLIAFNASR